MLPHWFIIGTLASQYTDQDREKEQLPGHPHLPHSPARFGDVPEGNPSVAPAEQPAPSPADAAPSGFVTVVATPGKGEELVGGEGEGGVVRRDGGLLEGAPVAAYHLTETEREMLAKIEEDENKRPEEW